MKDIPLFTTPYGVASLSMREIPYRKAAYIQILSCDCVTELVEECVSFCRACGAEYVYAKGHEALERYPLYTQIWRMCADRSGLIGDTALLYPVVPENVDHWRDIYNERMSDVPCAAYMTAKDSTELCNSGEGYYIHKDGKLLGIGRIAGNCIRVIVSAQKGSGEIILATLAELTEDPSIVVEVSADNIPAMKLYRKMGFIKTSEIARWHKVFG